MPALSPYKAKGIPERLTRWLNELRNLVQRLPDEIEGTGSPEGVVTAPRRTRFYRTDGAAGTLLYVKTTTTGNTGWVAYG